jgi:hypothetical protein
MRTTELLSVCRFTAGTPSAITVAEALIGLRVWVCEFIDAGLILRPIAGALSGAAAVAVWPPSEAVSCMATRPSSCHMGCVPAEEIVTGSGDNVAKKGKSSILGVREAHSLGVHAS